MSNFLSELNYLGIFFMVLLIIFAIINILMWVLIPFWILNIKTNINNILFYLEKYLKEKNN
jgi:branched-subunit amino acid transport protein AzlD